MSERPDLDALLALPESDPRLQALEPADHARLRALREFVAPGEVPSGARLGEAEARLAARLEAELGLPVGGAGAQSSAAATSAPAKAAGDSGRGFFRSLVAPAWRPAFALAALLVVAGGVWMFRASTREPAILRGPRAGAPEGGIESSRQPMRLPGGALELEWQALPGATRYTIVFLSADLDEIARIPNLTETRCVLDPARLPSGLDKGEQVLWHVVGMRDGDEIGRSRTLPLTLPE